MVVLIIKPHWWIFALLPCLTWASGFVPTALPIARALVPSALPIAFIPRGIIPSPILTAPLGPDIAQVDCDSPNEAGKDANDRDESTESTPTVSSSTGGAAVVALAVVTNSVAVTAALDSTDTNLAQGQGGPDDRTQCNNNKNPMALVNRLAIKLVRRNPLIKRRRRSSAL